LMPPGGTPALLDGRSRLDALCHAGIKFEIKVIDGRVVIDAPGYDIPAPQEIIPDENFNAYEFVLSTNLHRRHLKNTDKRAITKKVITAQPALSDRAVARMVCFDHKTVRAIRQETYGEIPHKNDRVEASGRKARGRKPGQIKEVSIAHQKAGADDSLYMPPDVGPIVPIATTIVPSTKTKPAVASGGFDAVLKAAYRVEAALRGPYSAPNYDAAREEIKRVIDLLRTHKTLKPTAAERAQAA